MRSSIYYCDPMRSGQKGGIEQAHTMLRMILPKKTSFEYLLSGWNLTIHIFGMRSVEFSFTQKLSRDLFAMPEIKMFYGKLI